MKNATKEPITYVALLRGINVGGNNIIKMSELAKTFERLKFSGVRTYIQSGNVVFVSASTDARGLEKTLEKAIAKEYKTESKVLVRSLEEMRRVVNSIPKGWDNPKRKYNVIFLRPSIDSKEVLKGLNLKDGIEVVVYRPGVLFWAANTSDLTRTSMVKLSSKQIYKEMTVRNLNTTKKLLELMQKAGKADE